MLCAAGLALLLLAATGVLTAARWVGQPFPGFLVLSNRVVASAGLGHWPATARGEIYQHEIVAVDGRPLDSVAQLHARVRALPVGTPLEYRLRAEGREQVRSIATRRFERSDFWLLFGAYVLNGLALGATALVVLYLLGRDPLANATVPLLWLAALWGLTATDLYGPYRLFRLHALCEALLPAAALQMALGFPQPLRWTRGRPWLPWVPYALALGLACVYQLGLEDPERYVRAHLAATSAFGAALLLLIASQVYRYLDRTAFESRQRIKVLALGAAAALTPPVVVALASGVTGGRTPQNVMAFTAFLFPLSIGYATLRHNLLGVDVFLRRSLSYAVLTLAMAALYIGAIVGLETLLQSTAVRDSGWFALAFAALCVTLLLPLHTRLQSGLDRIFFRSSYDFRRTVETVSGRLASVNELGVIASEIEKAAHDTLHPQAVVLYVAQNGMLQRIEAGGPEPAEAHDALELAQDAAGPFDLEGGGLGVPFRNEGTLVAVLVLGRRESGRIYGGDDRRLLQTLAHQGALAVRNAAALERVNELNRSLEAKVAARTRELSEALHKLAEKNQELAELSTIDQVTGLRTRRHAMERLEVELARCHRHGATLAVIMMDLDNFKSVNDTYGHLAGDEVLRRVGEIVEHNLRATDVAARYGGEELLVALVESSVEAARVFSERLRQGVEALSFRSADGRSFGVTASFGVAIFRPDHACAEDILGEADAALYRAKDAGRNRVELARTT